jgi:hypothetical protein
MKKIHFSILIDAAPEAVWEAMLEPDTYKLWTAEFTEGSYYEGSWEEGQKIRFMAPGGGGMTSVIAASRPYEFISIKHLGFIKDGVEDTESEEVRKWAPAFENYSFSRVGDGAELKVEIDVTPDFEEYMQNVWPKALARLKSICEGS